LDDDLRMQLWEQEQLELMQQQEIHSRLWGEKTMRLTYRDRQSSNSPALKFASTRQGSNTSTSSSTACPSPVLSSNVQQPQPTRGAPNSTGSSSGSLVLENVLPHSNNNSSTDLHIHVSGSPTSSRPQTTRRDSRPTSPTTQRLVERVLREWLEQELKNTTASANAGSPPTSRTAGGRSSDDDVVADSPASVGDQRIAITVAQ
jgi:hypothetical protein